VAADLAIHDLHGGATTHAIAGQPLGIASLPNLRDVGGYSTRTGGRVRTGLVYRSTALARLDGPDAEAFAALNIRTVYDLRTALERTSAPDRLPPGTTHVVADVIDGKVEGSPGHMLELLSRPEVAERELGGDRATALWLRHYRDFVRLDSARAAYGSVFRGVAEEPLRPVLFHCSTGKDRTGWAAAALLLFLGVDYPDVMDDYLASARYVEPMLQPFAEEYASRGGDPALIHAVFATLPAYLDASLDEVRRTYGDIEGYVADGLGIDGDTRAAIRDALVDRG
jgi:protein-tyrosine phosphatase